MALDSEPVNFQPCQFFISQSAKLSSLLDTIAREASDEIDPDACIDYLELTQILTELLNQSQALSVLSPTLLSGRWHDIQIFVSRVQTIQEIVADWDSRVRRVPQRSSDTSRKRARSVTLEAETIIASKRPRGESEDHEMVLDAVANFPPLERSNKQWWTEPLYDRNMRS
jgi:hypothetical protein